MKQFFVDLLGLQCEAYLKKCSPGIILIVKYSVCSCECVLSCSLLQVTLASLAQVQLRTQRTELGSEVLDVEVGCGRQEGVLKEVRGGTTSNIRRVSNVHFPEKKAAGAKA